MWWLLGEWVGGLGPTGENEREKREGRGGARVGLTCHMDTTSVLNSYFNTV